jgi:hypothetical protein
MTIHESGAGDALDLGEGATTLLVTLGVTQTVEQESLILSLYGSQDGNEWSAAPIAKFPEKFYEGVSSVLIEPQGQEPFRYLRAQWKANRWGRGSKTPMFRMYVFAEHAA